MNTIVVVALKRPYTFVVLAILILLFGTMAVFKTPTDIFPNIGIPVISVVWQYTGLPPDEMTGRIMTPFERALTTTVNDAYGSCLVAKGTGVVLNDQMDDFAVAPGVPNVYGLRGTRLTAVAP